MAILSGNADLWTENAGYNQDIGIYVSGGNGAYPTVAGQPEAWKESGGKAGTYSPNAAFVQAVLQLAAGQTYQARLQWKSNIGDPGTIVAGAGPIPDGPTTHSLTRLTLLFVPDSGNTTVIDRSTSEQKSLALSDGVTWTAMDSIGAGGGPLTAEFTAPADCLAVISGNADLFTNTAGYNQDIGISISGGDYPANPDQPIAWKESGGFAGTFSPNAAFVQTVIPVKSGVRYQAWLVWKTNIHTLWNGTPPVPAIYAGAGPIPNGPNGHSLTRLTVHLAACP